MSSIPWLGLAMVVEEAKKEELRKQIQQKQMEFNLMMERLKRRSK